MATERGGDQKRVGLTWPAVWHSGTKRGRPDPQRTSTPPRWGQLQAWGVWPGFRVKVKHAPNAWEPPNRRRATWGICATSPAAETAPAPNLRPQQGEVDTVLNVTSVLPHRIGNLAVPRLVIGMGHPPGQRIGGGLQAIPCDGGDRAKGQLGVLPVTAQRRYLRWSGGTNLRLKLQVNKK